MTNIDPEHLDFYGSFDGVRAAFEHFVTNVPFYGFAAMCILRTIGDMPGPDGIKCPWRNQIDAFGPLLK